MSALSIPSSHNGDQNNLKNKKEALSEMGGGLIDVRHFMPDSGGAERNASRNQMRP